jgi:hypothetical protein
MKVKFRTLLLLLLWPFAFCLFTFVPACSRHAAPDPGGPRITLQPPTQIEPALVTVTGLAGQDLSRLRDARLTGDQWQALLTVTVRDTALDSLGRPPVQGRYAVTPSAITFTPIYPFDPGRAYDVVFNRSQLPRAQPSPPVVAVVQLPALAASPTTIVTAVYPSAERLPENTLRLYIEFSAPMGNAGALDFVRLTDDRGRPVDIPFLPVQADFWNADHTRYTLFFDPGRVKLGIRPNEELGRPLHAGQTYTLQISADWRDAQGQPLKVPYRREFRVGPPQESPITPARWRLEPPAAGTRDPLVAIFPEPLDHGLLARALGVEDGSRRPVDGEITLDAADTRWSFRPAAPWAAGVYQLVALAILEDPAGNRIGRAFEVDMNRATAASASPEAYRLPFNVADSGF